MKRAPRSIWVTEACFRRGGPWYAMAGYCGETRVQCEKWHPDLLAMLKVYKVRAVRYTPTSDS